MSYHAYSFESESEFEEDTDHGSQETKRFEHLDSNFSSPSHHNSSPQRAPSGRGRDYRQGQNGRSRENVHARSTGRDSDRFHDRHDRHGNRGAMHVGHNREYSQGRNTRYGEERYAGRGKNYAQAFSEHRSGRGTIHAGQDRGYAQGRNTRYGEERYSGSEGARHREQRKYHDEKHKEKSQRSRQARAPRPQSPPILIQESLFLLPEHPLTRDFQRAIGMAKGTILEVDPRKKRGIIEIDGFKYKFEDERRYDLQRKYPIQKFLGREIMFAFWPTYSQKAAQYRQIDDAPTIKIANLRRTLPVENAVEIIGEVVMIEENLFVMGVFSASQKKQYMVTVTGQFPGEVGAFIQVLGELKHGKIIYQSHRNLMVHDTPEVLAT